MKTSDERVHAHVEELLSGYLDGELTQQEQQAVDLHLQVCSECSETLAGLRAIRQRLGQAQIGNSNTNHWREKMDDTGVRVSRGIGWVLLIAAAIAIIGIGVVAFLFTPPLGSWEKLLIAAVYIGLGALLLSVLRQRLIERKTDKYKDVEI